MRVTNNMIMKNSSYNINGNKVSVDKVNTQMTTQKKISRPSDDPVLAVRSLRLSTNLSTINQYYKKNIPDAHSWLSVTETALLNMRSALTDMRTQCVNGANDTLTQEDRHTILAQLSTLQDQIYAEGNADYAGRTVFTGYRTDQDLVFSTDEADRFYTIDQTLGYADIESYRYYDKYVETPSTQDEVLNSTINDIEQTEYNRVRLAYNKIDQFNELSYTIGNNTVTYDIASATTNNTTDANGNTITYRTAAAGGGTLYIVENQTDWATIMNGKTVGENDMVMIKETGELVLGDTIASNLKSGKATIHTQYDREGFAKGELKPEYYFDCVDKTADITAGKTNEANWVHHQKFDANGEELGYDIEYNISANQALTVNLEASDVFNQDIQRDIGEMITAVSDAINAHDKVDKIKAMQKETQYSTPEYQTKLGKWLEAAQKEADYADYNLKKLFSTELGKVEGYLSDVSLGITKVGCTEDQLNLTEARMDTQKETVESLQSQNDDMDLSEIIINYTAAYTAYQASLTAAGKLGQMTLLNYI